LSHQSGQSQVTLSHWFASSSQCGGGFK